MCVCGGGWGGQGYVTLSFLPPPSERRAAFMAAVVKLSALNARWLQVHASVSLLSGVLGRLVGGGGVEDIHWGLWAPINWGWSAATSTGWRRSWSLRVFALWLPFTGWDTHTVKKETKNKQVLTHKSRWLQRRKLKRMRQPLPSLTWLEQSGSSHPC